MYIDFKIIIKSKGYLNLGVPQKGITETIENKTKISIIKYFFSLMQNTDVT